MELDIWDFSKYAFTFHVLLKFYNSNRTIACGFARKLAVENPYMGTPLSGNPCLANPYLP
jgi:hypothetical protein